MTSETTDLYDYGICQACGERMIYDRQEETRPHGNDEWHPECCPECNPDPQAKKGQ